MDTTNNTNQCQKYTTNGNDDTDGITDAVPASGNHKYGENMSAWKRTSLLLLGYQWNDIKLFVRPLGIELSAKTG